MHEEQGGTESAMRLSLHEIRGTVKGQIRWTPRAIEHINRRIKSLALITNIIENTPPPPKYEERKDTLIKIW